MLMKSIQIPAEIKGLVDELRKLRPENSKGEKREKEILTLLKQHTEQQPAMLRWNKDIVCMIEEAHAARVDADKLRSTYPDVAADCTTESTYLKVKLC